MKRITHEAITRVLADIASGGMLKTACTREGVGYHRAWRMLKKHYPEEYTQAKECGTQALVDMAFSRALNSTDETAESDRMFCDFVRWLADVNRKRKIPPK